MTPEELYNEFTIAMAETEMFTEGKTRFGKMDRRAYFFEGKEIAHEHSDGWIDFKIPKILRSHLKDDRRVRPRTGSDWAEFLLSNIEDIRFIISFLKRACS